MRHRTLSAIRNILLLLLVTTTAWAQQEDNKLSVGEVTAKVGTTFDLPVYMENTSSKLTAIQFDVTVPDGIKFYTAENSYDEKRYVTKEQNRLNDHEVRVKWLPTYNGYAANTYRVIMVSPTNKTVRANRGKLFSMRAYSSNDVDLEENGEYPFTVSNVVLSDSLGNNMVTSYANGKLIVAGSPDFVVRNISITSDGSGTEGGRKKFDPEQEFTLQWTVENRGDEANTEGEGWSEHVYVVGIEADNSGNPKIDENKNFVYTGERCQVGIARHITEQLEGGAFKIYSSTFTMPKIIGIDGLFAVEVKLVPNGASGERAANQGNNTTLSSQNEELDGSLIDTRAAGIYFLGKRMYVDMLDNIREAGGGQPNWSSCTFTRSGSTRTAINFDLTLTKPEGDARFKLTDAWNNITTQAQFSIGSSTASANVRVDDDQLLNGDVVDFTVALTAAHGYNAVSASGHVIDDERPTLSITLTDADGQPIETLNEGDHFKLHVSANRASSEAYAVGLSVNYKGNYGYSVARIKMPATVVMPIGETSVDVDCEVLQDYTPMNKQILEFKATYADFHPAVVEQDIADDDMPVLTMTLSPTTVSEGAGPNAVIVKLRRDAEHAKGKVAIMIETLDDQQNPQPSTRLYTNKESFTLQPGVIEAQFSLGVVDNDQKDGDAVVKVVARVYMQICSCSTEQAQGGYVEGTVTVLDNDSEALTLKSQRSNIKEGSSGNVFTVSRNDDPVSALTVTIESQGSSDIHHPATVTIPAGQKEATFEVSMDQNQESEDSKTITFYAKANGYSTGTCWVQSTDQTLPDAVIENLVVANADAVYATREATFSFDLKNCGYAALPAGTSVSVYCENKVLATFVTETALSHEEGSNVIHFTGKSVINDVAGSWFIYAKASLPASQSAEANSENNNSERLSVSVKPLFAVTQLTTDKIYYGTNDVVTFTGKAEGLETAETDVEIYAIQGANRVVIPAKTDEEGRFTATWEHPGALAGPYDFGACSPGENLRTRFNTINFYGMRRIESSFLTHELEENETRTYYIGLKNHGTETLNNITMEVVGDAPEGIVLTPTTIPQLAANEMTNLSYTIKGTAASVNPLEWQTVQVRISSNEGAELTQTLYYVVYAATPRLKSSVEYINTTMVKGKTVTFEIPLSNQGNRETGEIYVDLGNISWMSTATPQRIASLQKGDETTAVLQFRPTATMEENSVYQGTLSIAAANGSGVSIPFNIQCVASETGQLVVDVWDEFTTQGGAEAVGPHVEGATVTVLHPVTQALVSQAETGSDGTATFPTLNAGKYILKVTHPKHDSYQQEVYVVANRSISQRVFLPYSAITISMTYEPTEVEDVYTIETTVVFETNVPRPEVKIDMPENLYLEELDMPHLFYITATNIGLVTAAEGYLEMDEWVGNYHFVPLIEIPKTLVPQQSVVIPVQVTLEEAPVGARRRGGLPGGFAQCALAAMCHYKDPCKYHDYSSGNQMPVQKQCGDIVNLATAVYAALGGVRPPGGGTPGTPGGGTNVSTVPGNGVTNVACDRCLDPENNLDALGEISDKPKDSAKAAAQLLKPCPDGGPRFTPPVYTRSSSRKYRAAADSYAQEDYAQALDDAFQDMQTQMLYYREVVRHLNEYADPKNPNPPLNIPSVGEPDWRAIGVWGDDKEYEFFKVEEWMPSYMKAYNIDVAVIHDVNYHKMCYNYHITNSSDFEWVEPKELRTIVERITALHNADNSLTTEQLIANEQVAALKPTALTASQYGTVVDRINKGFDHGALGADEYVDFDLLSQLYDRIQTGTMEVNRRGYATPEEMLTARSLQVKEKLQMNKESVCAHVKLKISQTMTMTRQAVRGTLTVENGSSTKAMEDVTLNLVVTDPYGNVATSHIMEIHTESLTGFTGELDFHSGWTLAAKETGVATIIFIPTRYAAPNEPVQYTFAGTITFRDPFSGEMMTRELETERLTVTPSPVLDLTYFMQRDIYGDDPLTDEVESIIPAQFSLLIHNKGNGNATKVKMVTNQPEIVDNEKSLFVDFEILSAQLNGGDKTMALGESVTTDFGDIPAHSTMYAQWWLTSSLTGHFVDYQVNATHVTSYDNPDLTLLDEVTIHELIHQIVIPGHENDTPPLIGFMANDVEDYDDLPDKLYVSDATTAPISVTTAATTTYNELDDTYLLTVTPKAEGWNYGKLPDPTGGKRKLVSVKRYGSNEALPIENFWQTDRTLVDKQDPVYENLLHFCDMIADPNNNAQYVLTFEVRPKVSLQVASVSGIPDNSKDEYFTKERIRTVTVTFNKEVNAETFTTDDLAFMHEGVIQSKDNISIVKVNATTFNVVFGEHDTDLDGYYTLTIHTNGIKDSDGFFGETGKMVGWIQTTDGKANLTVEVEPAGAGTTTPETARQDIFGVVHLTATPNTGYQFQHWEVKGKDVSQEASYDYQMRGAGSIKAVFLPEKRLLTVNYDSNAGTIEGGGTGYVDYDQEISLKPKANTGYYFAGWLDKDDKPVEAGENDELALTIKTDATYTAQFLPLQLATVMIDEDSNDNVTPFTGAAQGVRGSQFNVKVKRKLSTGQWNTFCVPFDISEQQINKMWGYQTRLVTLKSMTDNTLNMEYAWNIKAGVPYLMWPEMTIEVPEFEYKGNMVFSEEPNPLVFQNNEGLDFKYVGIYSPREWDTSKGEEYYLNVAKSKLVKAKNTTAALKGLRGYFVIPASVSNARINILDVETDIFEVLSDEDIIVEGCRIYNIQGQYVGNDINKLSSGIYIINGHKCIVK